ncbi:DUF2793 domain-containing protein [Sagittula salina]|uniref:DUF2793 domain-containing protein n=1 Tax=Sagittula salina TaxID=2820268 RepID=A0A940S2V6_9RHOB|nr:DUF2793 domain-containing protein [Sagittula salina]MBP0484487.1 DUF2793 domain-containing protein [Sagittula salina]
MPDVSAVLSLPYLLPAQAQKHVTHNAALAMLDVAVQLAVISRSEVSPPPTAVDGDRYLLPAGASGDWAGHADEIAVKDQGAWTFHAPVAGWRATVLDEDAVARFDGSAWQSGEGALRAETLGVNTSADATNRLSVTAPATLLTHEGAGHQLKINKAGVSDTASLLFQSNWSGRAEMGLAGTDGFAIKVSANGSAWTTALSLDPATGVASGAAVQASATDVTAGRLARADYAYGRGNLLGTVGQSGGTPTGAVIERGAGAGGDWVRFADGTQICWSPQFTVSVSTAAGALFRSSVTTWTYPRAFSNVPALTPGRQNATTTHWTVAGAATTTTGEVCGFSFQSTTGRAVSLVAVGRWF